MSASAVSLLLVTWIFRPPLTIVPVCLSHVPAQASAPTMNSFTSWYALSRSSFTMIFSCGASGLFAKSISASACFSRLRMASSLSVPRPRSRCSSTSLEGGLKNKKRGRGNVGWFATCLTPCTKSRQHISARFDSGLICLLIRISTMW